MSELTDRITKAINHGIPGDVGGIIAEVEALEQTEHRARMLLTKLEAHIRNAREMFHVLRNDKGRDDQGLDMKHIDTWLRAVHKTLHPTASDSVDAAEVE